MKVHSVLRKKKKKRCGDFMATAFIFSSNIEVSGIEKDSNNLRVLCSPKIRATTERNASYLQFLETTGKFSL